MNRSHVDCENNCVPMSKVKTTIKILLALFLANLAAQTFPYYMVRGMGLNINSNTVKVDQQGREAEVIHSDIKKLLAGVNQIKGRLGIETP